MRPRAPAARTWRRPAPVATASTTSAARKDPQSRTYHFNIAATCAACHGNKDVIAKGHIAAGDVATPFADSIHGRGLSRSGLLVAPTCSDCHGPHDIRRKSDPASRVSLANTAATCGKCHEGIAHQFAGGVHASVLAKGNNGAPSCQTCHTAHAIGQAANPEWQLSVVSQCGTCHEDKLKTYRDTFHGQATKLGFRAVATCADCHGNHRILPASDPASPIAPREPDPDLRQVPRRMPARASSKYDPHADKHNRERNAGLFYASKMMQALLFGTFGFFGLHTLLWLVARSASKASRNGRDRRRSGCLRRRLHPDAHPALRSHRSHAARVPHAQLPRPGGHRAAGALQRRALGAAAGAA